MEELRNLKLCKSKSAFMYTSRGRINFIRLNMFIFYALMYYIYLHEPWPAMKKSMYLGFQLREVTASFFALSFENFHKGNNVPSWSR